MHEINLKQLDLNLLVALYALLEERHVSRAADRINLSQSALSHALARLRIMFQDPLLVKGSTGMTLTVRAKNLYQPLKNILQDINHIISPPSLDLATMQDEIIIATRDNELATLLPKIITEASKKAPNLKLSIIPMMGDDLSLLENNKADFILAGTDSKSATLHRYVLCEEKMSCIVAKKNPALREGINLEKYVQMKHCLVTISNTGVGVVDSILAKKNLKRDIALRVPHFLAVPYIIAHSDLIATLPQRICELISQQGNIVVIDPPLKLPKCSIYLYWHVRNQENPIHKWFRKLINHTINPSQP